MNIERTIEFILESQAKAEIRMEKFDARMEKFDARMEKADARVVAMEKRLDKRMDAITKLLQQGMRILAKTQSELADLAKAQKRTEIRLAELAETQKELAAAQKATDRSLKTLIDSLRNGRNGH